jgi:hypothetical protein
LGVIRSAVRQAVRQLAGVCSMRRDRRSGRRWLRSRKSRRSRGETVGRVRYVGASSRTTARWRVLESYAAHAACYFIYFQSRAQRSAPLRLFIESAKKLSVRAMK